MVELPDELVNERNRDFSSTTSGLTVSRGCLELSGIQGHVEVLLDLSYYDGSCFVTYIHMKMVR